MDLPTATILTQDGVTSGAIYALLALALALMFSVTRMIFIPQGEFVAYGVLTLAAAQADKTPLSASILATLGALTSLVKIGHTLLRPELCPHALRTSAVYAGKCLVFPVAVHVTAHILGPITLPMLTRVALTLLIVISMSLMIYHLAYEPLAEANTPVLLIVSMDVHFAMTDLSLVMFGTGDSCTGAFSDTRFDLGMLSVSGQSLWVMAVSVLMIATLYFYFDHTVSDKALWAMMVNRLDTWLVDIRTTQTERLALTLAAMLNTLYGTLIAPLTTVYYKFGFLTGLKGLVDVVVGGLMSYPVAALGTLLAGLLESYSSFQASTFKKVIVFTLIIPVLLRRSFTAKRVEGEE